MLVLGELLILSCFALLVVVSMMMIVFVRSCFRMSFRVRCSVKVLHRVMSNCSGVLLLFLLMLLSADCISFVVVFLLLLSW